MSCWFYGHNKRIMCKISHNRCYYNWQDFEHCPVYLEGVKGGFKLE